MESIWIPYAVIAVIMGAVAIVFGVSLIRLQDSMGELSRVAGIFPAVVVEILVLYHGYEYLSKSPDGVTAA